jgi:cysteine desulfurase/selenocysteine lyase
VTALPRSAFPVVDRWAWFNHAGTGPLPRSAVAAIAARATAQSLDAAAAWDDHLEQAAAARASAAALLGVPVDDVAFVKNTTEGLAFVAGGLDLPPGSRVVLPDCEFPSTVYPWVALRDRGVVVDLVPLDGLHDAIASGQPPAVVVASWVQFGRGRRLDLEALATAAHGAGALLCVDVIQGLGVLPSRLDDWGVDMAMADGHKWLLGPEGCGLLYVRGSVRDRLRPLEPGWNSVAHREQWDNLELVHDDSARRYEGGTPNTAGIAGLGASIDLLLAAGVDAVWAHVDRLCDRLCDGLAGLGATVLSDRSAGGRSGIVTVRFEGGVRNGDLWQELRAAGIYTATRGGGVRLSPHGYTSDEECDRLLDVASRAARR